MNRNIIYISLAALLLGIFLLLKFKKDNKSSSTDDFHIENVNDIYAIHISGKYGEEVHLTKKEKKWYVSDTIEASKPKMIMLLETLNHLEVNYPLTDELKALALNNLRKNATKVEVLDKKGHELKTIFIGNKHREKGNYMILSEDGVVSEQPYLVKLPGESKDILYRMSLNPSNWRSKEILSVPLDHILSVHVQYPEHVNYNFLLTKDEDLVKITPDVDSITIDKPLDQQKVVNTLLAFDGLYFEGLIEEDTLIQQIKRTPVFAKIDITDVFEDETTIFLYKKPNSGKFHQVDKAGKPIPFDLDKFWAYIPNKNQYALVQNYLFGDILRDYEYFFSKN